MPEKKKRTKYISYLVRFFIAAAALYFAFKGENLNKIGSVLLHLNWWIFAAALGIYVVSQFIFVCRWYLLLTVQGIRIGFWPAIRLHFLGLFYNNCLPSSVGGDLLRAWYVTKHTDKKLQAAMSVFVDRIIGLTGSILMAFSGYFLIPIRNRQSQFNITYKNPLKILIEHENAILIAVLVCGLLISIFAFTDKGKNLFSRWTKFVKEHGLNLLRRGHESIRIYYNNKLAVLGALMLTFVCQSVFILALILIGENIDFNCNFKYYFIFFPISWVIGSLPISVGGAGVTEWWLKDIFVRVCGVSSELALVLALCQRLLWVFGSLPGAVIHLLGAHLPEELNGKTGLEQAEEFSIDYQKPLN